MEIFSNQTVQDQQPHQLQIGQSVRSLDLNQKQNNFADLGNIILPQNFLISQNKYGYCLLSTRNIKKDELVYKSKVKTLGPEITSYKFTIDGKEYVSNCVNSVKLQNGKGRHAYTFDGFMNHSCDPNTYTIVLSEDCDDFENYAARDISIGEEISVNYLEFDYECDGHTFDCLCNLSRCYKSIRGFKNLNLAQKIQLLPKTYPNVIKAWLRDNPQIILFDNLNLCKEVEICDFEGSKKLEARRRLNKDEIICKLNPIPIQKDSVIIMKVGNKYEAVELKTIESSQDHPLRKTFDMRFFMNYSSTPNTSIIQSQTGELTLVCSRNIENGQEITHGEIIRKYQQFVSKHHLKSSEIEKEV